MVLLQIPTHPTLVAQCSAWDPAVPTSVPNPSTITSDMYIEGYPLSVPAIDSASSTALPMSSTWRTHRGSGKESRETPQSH